MNLVPGLFTVPDVVADQPFVLEFQLGASMQCNPCRGAGFYDIDASDTLKITGITILDPLTQQPIPGATVTAASGTTYPVGLQGTVPEPATVLFCLIGLSGLAARRLALQHGSRRWN